MVYALGTWGLLCGRGICSMDMGYVFSLEKYVFLFDKNNQAIKRSRDGSIDSIDSSHSIDSINRSMGRSLDGMNLELTRIEMIPDGVPGPSAIRCHLRRALSLSDRLVHAYLKFLEARRTVFVSSSARI